MRSIVFQSCLLLCVLIFSLPGCAPVSVPPEILPQKTPLYRPPTPAGETPTSASSSEGSSQAESAGPLPTAPCKDNLTFLTDLTIPDGTVVSPDATLDKRWQVENNGNCNWGESYRIRMIAGSGLDAQQEQALYPARSGSQAVIRIVFKAPKEPGTYRSAWQAFNPQGEPFGDPFFIDIVVQ